MPDYTPFSEQRLDRTLQKIKDMIYTVIEPLAVRAWCSREPVPFSERRTGEERSLSVEDSWGGLFDSAWFRFSGRLPARSAGQHVVLLLDVNGELCVYDTNGNPVRGLTTPASEYDVTLGRPGKRVLQVTHAARGDEVIDVWADAGCNDLFGNLAGNGTLAQADIALCDDELRSLYYDFEVLLDLMSVLPEGAVLGLRVRLALIAVAQIVSGASPQWARVAREALAPLLSARGDASALHVSAIGHAHIDLAWLWPIRETIRKGARTFATALDLIDRYPDYVYGASQPQLYAWMKQSYPDLYRRIAEGVAEGRIEPLGALWVEADTNIPSGESLVRQLLLGRRFFRQEFDVDVDFAWIPDVFGYSAALPGILKRAGVHYFLTQKLSWSLVNKFPYHSFRWIGIDGSAILAHMFPEDTYNSPAAPRSVGRIERNYGEKGVSSHSLMAFGIGDGGGGPGAEHLERLSRIKNLPGLAPVNQEPVRDFLARWQSDGAAFPTWVGELYLERHQGTLTTQAASKKHNRNMENLLREWEWTSVVSEVVAGRRYPRSDLLRIWREVLLYQFHDILPGSSIKRVYDESLERYEVVSGEVRRGIEANLSDISTQINTSGMASPVVVFNSLSWPRQEWIKADKRWLHVVVPPMGHVVIDADSTAADAPQMIATETKLENDLLRVGFDGSGAVVSVYDKELERDVIPAGELANRLAVYSDPGDAWDFPCDYRGTDPTFMELSLSAPRVDGPMAILEQVYRIGHSELVQEISLTSGSRRLDFHSRARWRETASMLRTSFPVAVLNEEATFEIQYGHLRRPTHQNTSWDRAKDEVAAHRWADLSQRDFGVAILNDCKYGHRVKGHSLDLNLIRSVPYPGPEPLQIAETQPGEPNDSFTDQCDHVFTYSLYPHSGDHIDGLVVQAGYELNVPLRIVPVSSHPGSAGQQKSNLEVDDTGVIIEAVKLAEDNSDIVVRLYESQRRRVHTTLSMAFDVHEVWEVNLMEEDKRPIPVSHNSVNLEFDPFEIKTLRLERAGSSGSRGIAGHL